MPDCGGAVPASTETAQGGNWVGDGELVAALQRHDQDAVLTVYRRYVDAIYRYAYYQVGDAAMAEDVVSEVFLRMLEKIESYRYQGIPLSAWLYRIAHNLITDHFRAMGKRDGGNDHDSIVAALPDPARVVETRLTVEQLRQALCSLTEEQRQVVLLKFVEDLDNRHVATILGKSEGAIKSLQHRALDALRRLLARGAEQ